MIILVNINWNIYYELVGSILLDFDILPSTSSGGVHVSYAIKAIKAAIEAGSFNFTSTNGEIYTVEKTSFKSFATPDGMYQFCFICML